MKNILLKALLSFMSASDADLATFVAKVIKAVTGNTSLPSAQAVAADLVPALANYTQLLTQAQGGSRVQIEAKNVAKSALLDLLRECCRLVNFNANGDRLILLSSGFDISGDVKKVAAPAPVHELKAA